MPHGVRREPVMLSGSSDHRIDRHSWCFKGLRVLVLSREASDVPDSSIRLGCVDFQRDFVFALRISSTSSVNRSVTR